MPKINIIAPYKLSQTLAWHINFECYFSLLIAVIASRCDAGALILLEKWTHAINKSDKTS